jgi:hypothetical protein
MKSKGFFAKIVGTDYYFDNSWRLRKKAVRGDVQRLYS